MKKYQTFIIDDEEPARLLVRNYLESYTDFEITGEYQDGFNGAKAINEFKPDMVFLDIQMPKLDGFELLELLEHHPVIVFTTAYDQYAIKAFEMNAVDYLMKPFSRERFEQAIHKAAAKLKENLSFKNSVNSLITSHDQQNDELQRIAVRSGSGIQVIPVQDIHFFEAEGDYVMIHTKNNRYLKEKTMKYFESHLDPSQFIRVHRSYIVNVNEIGKIELYDKENHIVLLKNNPQRLKASKNGYKLLRKILNL